MEPKKPLQTHLTELGTYAPDELREDPTRSIDVDPLSEASLAALGRLAKHRAPPDNYPAPEKRAAVLVALFPSRNGQSLNVLLSTRSSKLRTYPGNVALPGGRMDAGDINLEATARREALEEVGLPDNPSQVRYLTSLRPFLARSLLLVTPVVCLILDLSLKPDLNPDEVDSVFSVPLSAFLDQTPSPALATSVSPEVMSGASVYHTHEDFAWYGGPKHRFHFFQTHPRAVTGLTAEIMIAVATVAYGRKPDFENHAPDQVPWRELIEAALKARLDEGDDTKKVETVKGKL